MPEYLVIAGPNGAGKSTLSKTISGSNTIIFDPDKEKKQIERNYPDISDEAVEEELTRVYRNFEMQAIGSQLNLTVESNLRNEFVAERAKFFKENGYKTSFILPILDDSMHRVNLRVNQKGHFVDRQSIAYNYRVSLENMSRVAAGFDQFMLMQAPIGKDKIIIPDALAIYKDRRLFYEKPDMPQWANPLITNLKNSFTPDDPGHNIKQGPKR
jgi:predicted ABC-type ATPase